MTGADLILARAERLALLGDLHRARKEHKATRALRRRLTLITAKLAAMEADQ